MPPRRVFVGASLTALLLSLVMPFLVFQLRAPEDEYELVVTGTGMAPTLADGVTIKARRATSLYRFDVVEYRYPEDPSRRFVGRIVGLPGEEIAVREGAVWIGGERLFEDYAPTMSYELASAIIPKDHVFILGDSRDNSLDSHVFGPVPKKLVSGIVVIRP